MAEIEEAGETACPTLPYYTEVVAACVRPVFS